MLPDFLSIIKIATAATNALKGIRPRQESRDGRVQDTVSMILRTLYFGPDGILSLLREVTAASSGLVVQALVNVALSAAFLSNGLFALLLLWAITPDPMVDAGGK